MRKDKAGKDNKQYRGQEAALLKKVVKEGDM